MLVTTIALAAVFAATPGRAGAASSTDGHVYATYHGRVIDLAVSWQGAQACAITDSGNACFDSEAEMNMRLGAELGAQDASLTASAEVSAALACSPSVKLYDSTGFTGAMVNITTRTTLVSLAGYGFSARTSSYIIGGCNSTLYDGSLIAYPGYTGAGGAAASMASGWNNRVAYVYIS